MSTNKPHDRLTRICGAMANTLSSHPENGDDDIKSIVFLNDGTVRGIVLRGYDDDTEAMVDLVIQLKAIFKEQGKEFLITSLNEG